FFGALSSLNCGKSDQPATETEPRAGTASSSTPSTPSVTQMSPTPGPASSSPAAPPRIDEVRNATARVFSKAATFDEHHVPGFLVADFNGDGSQDLAVVVEASESSLPEINNELANWTLEDPRLARIPGSKSVEQGLPTKPVRAQRGDSLLAIIH